MINSSNISVRSCRNNDAPATQFYLLLAIIPFHFLIMKILAKNLYFAVPRHIILFSLCLSDGIQVSTSIFFGVFHARASFTAETTECLVLRGTLIFILTSTLIVSCVAIIALSVERYIACVHSFRLHLLVTESRITYGSIGTWLMAILIPISALCASHNRFFQIPVRDSIFQIISVVCIFPTSIILIIIQSKLYVFGRKKLGQISPSQAFGVQLELSDYRKKHMKVTFVAGIVAFAFVFCMAPFASISMYELMFGDPVSPLVRRSCSYLAAMNAICDPFIYGIGMVDIRKKIWQEFKKFKGCLMEWILSKCSQYALP